MQLVKRMKEDVSSSPKNVVKNLNIRRKNKISKIFVCLLYQQAMNAGAEAVDINIHSFVT